MGLYPGESEKGPEEDWDLPIWFGCMEYSAERGPGKISLRFVHYDVTAH